MTCSITSRSSSASSHSGGIAASPYSAPARLPATAPVESESPEWLTASSSAERRSGVASTQWIAIASASSAIQPAPSASTSPSWARARCTAASVSSWPGCCRSAAVASSSARPIPAPASSPAIVFERNPAVR